MRVREGGREGERERERESKERERERERDRRVLFVVCLHQSIEENNVFVYGNVHVYTCTWAPASLFASDIATSYLL